MLLIFIKKQNTCIPLYPNLISFSPERQLHPELVSISLIFICICLQHKYMVINIQHYFICLEIIILSIICFFILFLGFTSADKIGINSLNVYHNLFILLMDICVVLFALVFCCYKQCCNGLSSSTSELPGFTLRRVKLRACETCVSSVLLDVDNLFSKNGCSNEYIINKIEYFSSFSTSSPVLDSTGLFNLYQFDGYKMVSRCFNFHLSDYC